MVEALARSGVGALTLVDHDEVSLTNLNRQLIALHSTMGMPKVEVARRRILDINPDAHVTTCQSFFLPENADTFDFTKYDYVVDAVDTVTAKIEIIMRAKSAGVPVISSMGTGNKLDPSKLVVTELFRTEMCPLAKVMRHEMKKRGVREVKVVYSTEAPLKPRTDVFSEEEMTSRRSTPGSCAFVPSAAGLLIASEVVRDLIAEGEPE